jgi:hypothetical protein
VDNISEQPFRGGHELNVPHRKVQNTSASQLRFEHHDVSTIESSTESVVEPHQIRCCLMQIFQVRCRIQLSPRGYVVPVRLDAGSCTHYKQASTVSPCTPSCPCLTDVVLAYAPLASMPTCGAPAESW